MSKKMAKFRQKKIKPQKEHVTYLPTYLPTYQSSRLALYQAHDIPEWNGPPMFLLYCSKPKKKKTLNSFTSSQRKKHWATIPLFHIELVSTLFLFVFFLFFHLGNFHQRSGPKGTFGNFSRVKCVPPSSVRRCATWLKKVPSKNTWLTLLTKGSCKPTSSSPMQLAWPNCLRTTFLFFHMFVGKKMTIWQNKLKLWVEQGNFSFSFFFLKKRLQGR
jgi:hypothetical protein